MDDHQIDEAKGRVKEAAGALADDEELEESGRADQREAGIKEKIDEIGEKAKDKVGEIADRLR